MALIAVGGDLWAVTTALSVPLPRHRWHLQTTPEAASLPVLITPSPSRAGFFWRQKTMATVDR